MEPRVGASAARWRNPGKRVLPAPDFASAPSGLRDFVASHEVLRIQFSNTACPPTRLRILAARCARALFRFSPPGNKRAQGRPGARCTRGPVCNCYWVKRTRAYRFSGGNPAFPAQWFYGLFRAHPGDRALLPPSPARLSASLTPASRCQVHTASPSARVTLVSRNFRVHRIPPRVRDDRDTPLSSGETGGAKALICPTG
jgi:hypothetical protein